MSAYEDDFMDFGDDDDGDFLTSKLAALGIDEDLELSGGEEENEDPATNSGSASNVNLEVTTRAPANGVYRQDTKYVQSSLPITDNATNKAPSSLLPLTSADDTWGDPKRTDRSGSDDQDWSRPPTTETYNDAAPAAGGEIEEGELEPRQLNMLDKPLKSSRAGPAQQEQNDRQRSTRKKTKRRRRSSKGGAVMHTGLAKGRNVTIKECATWVCEQLGEPKYYLMCQVVAEIGYNNSKRLLGEVQRTQDAGGMSTADGARKRTPGGIFFTLLKEYLDPARLKLLYADDVRVKKEKERARRAANKRKAAAVTAGEDVTLTTPRNPPRQRRGGTSSAAWSRSGEWAGPAFDSDGKRARAPSS